MIHPNNGNGNVSALVSSAVTNFKLSRTFTTYDYTYKSQKLFAQETAESVVISKGRFVFHFLPSMVYLVVASECSLTTHGWKGFIH